MASHPRIRRGHAALRRARCSIAAQIYLVTTTTARREDRFADFDIARGVCAQLALPTSWLDARLLAWVLMPDHWHGLVELGERFSLPRVVNRFKSVTALAGNRAGDCRGALWSRGFHDHASRADEALVDTARYIVLNPVRAGLVRRVWDYPFWDAVWLPETLRSRE